MQRDWLMLTRALNQNYHKQFALDHPGYRSNAFDMWIAEPLFQFCHSIPIPIVINTPQWNCCLGNMANTLHLMNDTDCENFFRINMDKHLSWFHQNLPKNNRIQFCKSTNLFQIMLTVFVHLFGYSIFLFRKLTFDELKMVVKECHLSMLHVLTHIQSETQKHVIRVFPSVEGDKTS